MKKRTFLIFMMSAVFAVLMAAAIPAGALPPPADPGGIPHYFGPYGNWAYSPLPKGRIGSITVDVGGSGYTAPVVTILDVYGTGSGATATAVTGALGAITGITVTGGGTGYSAPIVQITDTTGIDAATTANITVTIGSYTGVIGNPLIARPYATDGAANVFVVNTHAPLATGRLTAFQIFNQPGSGPRAFHAYVLRPTGVANQYNVVFDSGLLSVPSATTGTVTRFAVGPFAVLAGDLIAHYGQGIPITIPGGTGADTTLYPANAAPTGTVTLGTTYPILSTDRTYSLGAEVVLPTGGIRKFVDKVPGLTPAGINNLGQYIPLAVADSTTYPGSDYYEIGLVEYTEQMHSDLPATKLRGYVQLVTTNVQGIRYPLPGGKLGVDKPHYLGPTIVANSNKPVRIKFYNLLPTGAGGDLFLPVDETVAGSGFGPAGPGTAGERYTQNRAAVHLHGNNTVWISDGTPHQWITPANETTPYPQGVSVRNVPDMNPASVDSPTDGMMTIYYTNAMSARLMFYHDHAMGITRLNVYAGGAAGYVITDQVDQDMINGTNISGVNPGLLKVLPDIGIPLVIQDRTFVDPTTIWAQDPTWNWGTGTRDANGKITAAIAGDLWYPHVYMSAQNPWDLAGANAFGRWHYGPWFINQTPTCVNGLPLGCIEVGPVPNPYYQAACDLVPPGPGCTAPWEPPLMPGTPNPSTPGEAFMDTPIVNGTAYPYLQVEPKAYRFRVLNAANDRFLNLQLYVAADKTGPTTPSAITPATPAVLCNGAITVANCTEVAMVPVGVLPANQFADTPSGLPDPATKGPAWIQIGTEGGFLPKPVVIPQQPIGWNLNLTTFNLGNVNQHSLLLGTAERADVIVDFSAYAGKTLILYNDSPAAFPAGVSVYDYYTGVADQTGNGGAPTTQPGYGPNTRTIMQIRVGTTVGTPTPDVTLANLNAVFAKTASKSGVFEKYQDPIIVPQAAYNSAYNNTFTATAAGQYVQLHDFDKTFSPIDKTNVSGPHKPPVTLPLEMKAMHDEMGGVYDTQFGRMSGMLGLTLPSGTGVGTFYGYASPPTDIHMGSVSGSQIGSLPDGTQIWRIFHNGVDTHTIHVHLFNAQLINRVGQDGIMLAPDANELGWKDTFRVNPLEVTYIAMRPVIPTPAQVPFEVPDSVRLIDPTLPEGATLIPPPPAGWSDPDGVAITEILNHYVNFGWEYVWHCHILAHEESDMMHSLVFAVPPTAPTGLAYTVTGPAANPRVNLSWTDNSLKEAGFTIQRATDASFTMGLTTFTRAANLSPTVPSPGVTYQDTTVAPNVKYWYRVFALGNTVGDTQAYPGSLGFPTMTANSVSTSVAVNVGTPTTLVPANPTLLTTTVQAGPEVSLTWRDNATNETGFAVERCTVVAPAATCNNFALIATPGPRNNTGNVTYLDTTVTAGNTYRYQVWAVNAVGRSVSPAGPTNAVVPAIPAVPTNFRVAAAAVPGPNPNYTATLTWAATTNPTNFTIQRATNATFTTGLASFTPAANARSLTQTVTRNTTYYYRIRANSNIAGSSAWKNALPFPIRTGN